MREIKDCLFGNKSGFGIEIGRCFVFDKSLFGGVCLWVDGASIGDLTQSMAVYHLLGELDAIHYLPRMDPASLDRLLGLTPEAADISLRELEAGAHREVFRLSPGECFDGFDVRVIAAAYDLYFYGRLGTAAGSESVTRLSTAWVQFQPVVKAFVEFASSITKE